MSNQSTKKAVEERLQMTESTKRFARRAKLSEIHEACGEEKQLQRRG